MAVDQEQRLSATAGGAHGQEPSGGPNSQPRAPHAVVVYASLALGTAAVVSSIAKTWLGVPNAFDWFLLAMGVLLCGLSVFSRFSFTRNGLEVVLRQLDSLLRLMQHG